MTNGDNFYPRPPCGGRQCIYNAEVVDTVFLSTSPVWGTTVVLIQNTGSGIISIHVPRVGDDSSACAVVLRRQIFLSTSPVWGTTLSSIR